MGSGLVFLAGASHGRVGYCGAPAQAEMAQCAHRQDRDDLQMVVVALTALTFRNMTSILYCGITLYVCTQVLDAVVYSFDY